jgi:hypothetical protein
MDLKPGCGAKTLMTITIRLSDEEERRLSERAALDGQDVIDYVHRLIRRDIEAPTTLEQILAPLRQQFKESGMGDKDLDALVEEAREEVWQEKRARQSKLG